jgi:AcrR family transcriptional regulator
MMHHGVGGLPVTRSPDTTKSRLISAAEQLFAAQGIGAVSLREINRASGAKNAVAVQYHFDDRAGVIRAILTKHRPDIEAGRHAILDHYESEETSGSDALRVLAGALVRPLSAKLADRDGGPEYLQIYAELANHPRPLVEPAPPRDRHDSIQRWRSVVEPLLDRDALRLHIRFTAIRFAAAELGRRASSGPHTDDRLFVSQLVDLVSALLATPISDETARSAEARDRARATRRRPAQR